MKHVEIIAKVENELNEVFFLQFQVESIQGLLWDGQEVELVRVEVCKVMAIVFSIPVYDSSLDDRPKLALTRYHDRIQVHVPSLGHMFIQHRTIIKLEFEQ
jgi:hypothetical protein